MTPTPNPPPTGGGITGGGSTRPPSWKWLVCGLLLLATMLNYMDRQTLSQLAKTICDRYELSNQQYGDLEMGFGFAFAAGALFFGFLVDRFGPMWIYPIVLILWSAAGIATGYGDEIGRRLLTAISPDGAIPSPSESAYYGFMLCRVALGFFEAGHWPCALVTTQRILSREDRAFGNSILQSGAAIGAIFTPLIIMVMIGSDTSLWRLPFVTIGFVGMAWVVPWMILVRPRDLGLGPGVQEDKAPTLEGDRVESSSASIARIGSPNDDRVTASIPPASRSQEAAPARIDIRIPDAPPESYWRPFLVLVVVVILINVAWQLFRVWLPKFLETEHGYTLTEVGFFSMAYYLATDIGCIASGFAAKKLAEGGWRVHLARLTAFTVCAALTMLGLIVTQLSAGPLLLGLLLVVGAGALGLFPNYYSFTQELSKTHQGKITGILGFLAWIGTAPLQRVAGQTVDSTGSYATLITIASLAPLPCVVALWLFWERRSPPAPR